MNDTHGVEGNGWYGFDLDGTLAKYDGWKGIDHIGEPVEPMVDRIKKMHNEGKVVKILTARIAPHKLEDGTVGESYITIPDGEGGANRNYAHQFINDWCHFNLGFIPEIVYQKDHLMLELYDDRVKQVVPNEGLLVEDMYRECVKMLKQVHYENGCLNYKLESKFNWFLAGFLIAIFLYMLVGTGIKAYDTWFGQEKEPARARVEAVHNAIHDLLNDWPECEKHGVME